MKKLMFSFVICVFVLCALSVAFGNQDTEVKEMVDKAADTFKDKGSDYALKLLNAGSGPFKKGELYVFAISFTGVMLAHPANRELVGKDAKQIKDAKGQLIVQPMLEIAKNQGSGWTEYWWVRVNEKDPTLKRTYVKRVPGHDIFVAGGYYVK